MAEGLKRSFMIKIAFRFSSSIQARKSLSLETSYVLQIRHSRALGINSATARKPLAE